MAIDQYYFCQRWSVVSYLVYGNDKYVKNWVMGKIDYLHRLDNFVTTAIHVKTRMIAGIIYHDYQPEYDVIQMSMAAVSPMWAKKKIINRLLEYPFRQLKCYKVMIIIRSDNDKAIKTMKNIGFIQEAVLAHSYGKEMHAVILRMFKPDYIKLFGEV
jgi:hypothetical protein